MNINNDYMSYMDAVSESIGLVTYTYQNPAAGNALTYVMGFKNKNFEDRNLAHNTRAIASVTSKRQAFNVFISNNTLMLAMSKDPLTKEFVDDCFLKAFDIAETGEIEATDSKAAVIKLLCDKALGVSIFVPSDTTNEMRKYIVTRLSLAGISITEKNLLS